MEVKEFKEGIDKMQELYKKKLDNNTLNQWWLEFRGLSKDRWQDAINRITSKNRYFPTIQELRTATYEQGGIKNMNLNCSYWYKNLKDIEPTYNIKTGEPMAAWRR